MASVAHDKERGRWLARTALLLLVIVALASCLEETPGRSPGGIGDNPGPTTTSPQDSAAEADAPGDARADAPVDASTTSDVATDE